MKLWLNKIREPKKMQISKKIVNSLLILIIGIALGIFSKWLDNLSINDAIWWQRIVGVLDLRNIFSDFGIWIFIAVLISVFSATPFRASLNVFLFFIGMTISYHLYTILFCGFNPNSYMMIWYTITLISPILAFICWYAKGNGKLSIIISSWILAVMLLFSFSIGMWYFYFKSIVDTLLFVGIIIVIYNNYRNSICSLIGALVMAYTIRLFI
ncbi:MAG: hypothetical protein NC548_37520 [Lachnospiraceae bacterium]|nr:hypothetical protein [Lachnospiraceae bacterium]